MSLNSYYDTTEKDFAAKSDKGFVDSDYGFDKPTHDRDGMKSDGLDNAGPSSAGLFGRRISKQDIIYLTSQLAIMTDTGITLSTALQESRSRNRTRRCAIC